MMKQRFVIESNYKKYKRLNGFTCNGYSAYSVLLHARLKIQRKVKKDEKIVYIPYFSESELFTAYRKGKIRVIAIGDAEE